MYLYITYVYSPLYSKINNKMKIKTQEAGFAGGALNWYKKTGQTMRNNLGRLLIKVIIALPVRRYFNKAAKP